MVNGRVRRRFDREEALAQAMRLFWRKTYEGASLAELTEVMGINPPSLYAAFGSKGALFREAVALYAGQQGVEIWRSLEGTPTARDAIERFLSESAKAYSTPGDPPGCLIVLGAQHGFDDDDPAHDELRARRRRNLAQLTARLERGVAEGDLPAGFPSADAAAFFLSVQNGMSILARDGANRAALEAVARGAMLGWDGWIQGAQALA